MNAIEHQPALPAHTDRIIVIGCAGSGKSTLSVKLGQVLSLPVYHLDKIYWQRGWKSISEPEFDLKLAEILKLDRWIIDGNYARTLSPRFEACDAVIYLDFPRLVCLKNVFVRLLHYQGKTRPDLPEGCPEKIDLEFVAWIWNFNKTHRHKYYNLFRSSEKPVVILHSRRECDRFLCALSPSP
ncbi:MAG: hypothetical protein WA110_01565 [Anaerolineaceae bacterium]